LCCFDSAKGNLILDGKNAGFLYPDADADEALQAG
jgi:hypothetical protein